MITLTKKLKRESDASIPNGTTSKRASVRDKLLVKEVRLIWYSNIKNKKKKKKNSA
jgi:hypothetical protein